MNNRKDQQRPTVPYLKGIGSNGAFIQSSDYGPHSACRSPMKEKELPMDFESVQKRLQVLMEDALAANLADESALNMEPPSGKVESGPSDGLEVGKPPVSMVAGDQKHQGEFLCESVLNQERLQKSGICEKCCKIAEQDIRKAIPFLFS